MYTNKSGIALSLAVWLCTDDYDHSDDPNHISATSLLKPIRAIVLSRQNRELVRNMDIESLIPSRMGTALHTGVETSWLSMDNVREALTAMNYPDNLINRIKINPTEDELEEDTIAVYMEIRSTKQVGKFLVSGKFDFVAEGQLEDFKSTSVWSFIFGSSTEKFSQQGSIYKWLNPKLITSDIMKIQYIFTDWSGSKAKQDKNYPSKRLQEQRLPLMSNTETENFVTGILNKVEALETSPQSDLPLCNKEELWQKDDVWKYYKDPSKKTRSTKNFDNSNEAEIRFHADGSVGEIVKIPGEVVRCRYCEVCDVCDQAKAFIAQGLLVL